MLDLTCPNFQILIGSSDISKHVTGYSFRHPLAEPSTPLIWTGQIELDLTVDTSLGATFFDDEVNPSIWLSGLQPIDVYFNGTWWQRFRIKPSGYRYDQITGQAVVEITDIIGILDSYAPSADTPEFKTGGNNYWNDLAVALIRKQASIMGTTVTVQTPPYGIGGIFKVPRSVKNSYIKEAQKMAGERGYWMWSDKETVKWAEYPSTAQNIVWRKSRRELLNFTRQQGLDPVKQQVTVSCTHEDVDTCSEVFPKKTYTFASADINIRSSNVRSQRYQIISSIIVQDKIITGNHIYKLTKKINGNPALILFGGQIEATGNITVEIPDARGVLYSKVEKINTGGAKPSDWWIKYTLKETSLTSTNANFSFSWLNFAQLLDETDITTYENTPIDSQNPSKILSRVITRSEPWAKYPDGIKGFQASEWLYTNVNDTRRITERITTTYKYVEIKRDDIIVQTGQKLYEISEINELKEQVYFEKKTDSNLLNPALSPLTRIVPRLVASELTRTTYTKQCQGRWTERREFSQNKGQSTTNQGYLFANQVSEQDVTSIPDIIYRPAPYPVIQRPLLATVQTGSAGVSPFVQSKEFENASTLTTKAECERYAKYLGEIKWQRYYGRELASGFGTVLGYIPFQGVHAGNGAYIRDRFGISLNQEDEEWQFVEDCIGNKTGTIPEIAPPSYPAPPLLTSTLNIGDAPTQNLVQGVVIAPITFYSSGGLAPYTYTSTTLPSGLSLSSGGVLSGTPSAISTTSVTVTVTDALSATDSTTFNIVVSAAPIPVAITSETISINIDIGMDTGVEFLDGLPMPVDAVSTFIDSMQITFTPLRSLSLLTQTELNNLTLSELYTLTQ